MAHRKNSGANHQSGTALTLIDVLFFIVPLELCRLDRKIQHLLSGYIMADRLLHFTNNIIYIVQHYVKLSVGK